MGFNKKYFMRCPCKEEQKFMLDVFKKYQAENDSQLTVKEWGYNNLGNYDETPSNYGISIRAKGLIDWAGKPLPEDLGVNYLISKKKIKEFMKENGIVKPSFEKATFIKHRA